MKYRQRPKQTPKPPRRITSFVHETPKPPGRITSFVHAVTIAKAWLAPGWRNATLQGCADLDGRVLRKPLIQNGSSYPHQ
eukprot:10496415-Lingulodinium_polyedra.AAC.1